MSCGPLQLNLGAAAPAPSAADSTQPLGNMRSRSSKRRLACFAVDDDADLEPEEGPLLGDVEQRYSKVSIYTQLLDSRAKKCAGLSTAGTQFEGGDQAWAGVLAYSCT